MKWLQKNSPESRVGLVLPGGGARGAYQVGVLKAVARVLPKAYGTTSPFSVITGTSAGSINATALAIHANHFRKGVLRLSHVWKNFHAEQVFRTDTRGIFKSGGHWLAAMMLGGLGKYNPHSLLDRKPLVGLLNEYFDYSKIQQAIDDGHLHALGITASGYHSGQSVTFFQGADTIEPWSRERRIGLPTTLDISHLMASSAIPLLFSATRINREFFGDGSMRQTAPLSSALHLGADRVLVVGVQESKPAPPEREKVTEYPPMADILGHAMNSIFLDGLDSDLERVERINKTIGLIPTRKLERGGVTLRPVEVLCISPSRDIDEIAGRYAHLLPRSLRFLLRGVGVYGNHGSTLVSYLLFEKAFCRELIALGYKDAMNSKEQILNLFDSEKKG